MGYQGTWRKIPPNKLKNPMFNKHMVIRWETIELQDFPDGESKHDTRAEYVLSTYSMT